jgi:superfamily II DNA or RNA helicase
MAVHLRDYQEAAVQGVREAMRTHRRVLLVLPTGGGKTVCFCRVAEMVYSKGMRVTLMAHRIEIVRQISAALSREGVRHGMIAPDHHESSWPVQVAMVQTLAKRLGRVAKPDLIIVDEAHHAIAGSYAKIMEAWPDAFVLGVTATPARLDSRGLDSVFQTMVLGPSMRDLQERGYLCRYTYLAPPVVARLDNLKVRAGEYAADELVRAMDQRGVTGNAEAYYRKMLNGKPAIAFCASVEHAEHVSLLFQQAGWRAACVDGSMDRITRSNLIASIGDGRLNVLCSCDIISEGTDIPVVQGAIMLRPTMSLVTYMQQAGRVLRPKPDGSRAIILDHCGNVLRHGLPDAPRDWNLTGAPKRAQAAAVRVCAKCYAAFAPAPRCPECGVACASAAPSRKAPKTVAGDLTEVTDDNYLATAPLKNLIKAARTLADLEKVAAARGYKPAWAKLQYSFKTEARARYGRRDDGWGRHA